VGTLLGEDSPAVPATSSGSATTPLIPTILLTVPAPPAVGAFRPLGEPDGQGRTGHTWHAAAQPSVLAVLPPQDTPAVPADLAAQAAALAPLADTTVVLGVPGLDPAVLIAAATDAVVNPAGGEPRVVLVAADQTTGDLREQIQELSDRQPETIFVVAAGPWSVDRGVLVAGNGQTSVRWSAYLSGDQVGPADIAVRMGPNSLLRVRVNAVRQVLNELAASVRAHGGADPPVLERALGIEIATLLDDATRLITHGGGGAAHTIGEIEARLDDLVTQAASLDQE
jgi:Ni,Fe-hydrogenase III small subunit